MYLVADERLDGLEQHGRQHDPAGPADLVTESLRRSTAKQLALDQARPEPEIDDGADVGL